MRTKSVSVMLILLLAMLSPLAYAQTNSAAGGGGGTAETTTANGGGGETSDCAQEGGMCGGIAGFTCCGGLACEMEGNFPDAAGKCVKGTLKESRFRNAYWGCYDGKESYEGGPASCKSSETWQEYAEEFCKGHCSPDKIYPQKCGVNTFKVWNPCSGERNIIYCEDSPYDSDCVCREGERVPDYEEPACEGGIRCPLMNVRIKYKCLTKEKVIKARLGEQFEIETTQTAVIVDYNEMHVKLTAISVGKDIITPKMVVAGEAADAGGMRPDERPVAHLVITMPGSNKLVRAREETKTTIAKITGRAATSSAGGPVATGTVSTAGSGGGGTATTTTPSVGDGSATGAAPSAATVLRLRQGESAEVFGATITVEKLDRGHGAFVVSKKDIVPCAEYTKCDDGTIRPCYQEGNVCVCEACEVIDFPLCKPTVCPDGEKVECEWDGERCVCEACEVIDFPLCKPTVCPDGENVECEWDGESCVCEACEVIDFPLCKPAVCPDGENVECEWDGERCVCESCNIGYNPLPLCGNGICEEGEGMVCQGAGSGLGTAEEVCYISCPEDCGTIEEPGDCDGCVSGTRCLPYGSRRLIEDAAVYCDFEGQWQGQLAEGEACQNDYECKTNTCTSGKCLDLEKQLAETQSLLRKILDWLKRLFGGED